MSTLGQFGKFPELPYELQVKVWKEAIIADYTDRVVPVLHNTKRVVLPGNLMGPDSKFFSISESSSEAAEAIYDLSVLAHDNGSGEFQVVRLSTSLDIFFVSAWGFTLGIDTSGGSFPMSVAPIPHNALAKVERVMEHYLDLGDLVHNVMPTFNRSLFQAVKVCYLRLDHEKPTPQILANLIGGGPYTQADVLAHYTNPAIYEEVINPEAVEVDTEDDTEDGSEHGF
ncbi:hypothetical protein PG984_009830 [Apiospora sp. TS-2023a]